ncbi:MAG: glycosyltransferase family 2 protein [Cyanobacteria bacterium HKST-UBA03]|nr:glycosyltransferase family 2 protein [Cyanobacteria bacterium HKST-UBA03]
MTNPASVPVLSKALPVALPEISVVFPCLNEVETLASCVADAQQLFALLGVVGEIVVADNGSSDGSPQLARNLGCRVVDVAQRGYGAALMGGFDSCRGRILVMADCDMTYCLRDALPLVELVRQGQADMGIGLRLGGGYIEPGAMPLLHRYLGTPVLTGVLNLLHRSAYRDINSGLRVLSRDAYQRLPLHATGMAFASEMLVQAARHRLRVVEQPITYRLSGRSRPAHLKTWPDGWAHLMCMTKLAFAAPVSVVGEAADSATNHVADNVADQSVCVIPSASQTDDECLSKTS